MSEKICCPYCGTMNDFDSNFCNNCGISLGVDQINELPPQQLLQPQNPSAVVRETQILEDIKLKQQVILPQKPPAEVYVKHIHHGPDFCTVFCYVLLALCLIPILGVIIFYIFIWINF